MKKVYRTYGTPLKEIIYTSMKSQRKKETEKGIKSLFTSKEMLAEKCTNLGRYLDS